MQNFQLSIKMQAETITEIPSIYLRVHLKVQQYLGFDVLPIENPKRRIFFYIYSIILNGAMCTFTLTELLDLVLNYEDIYKLTFGACCFLTHILGCMKMVLILHLRKKLWGHFKTLEEGIFKPDVTRGGLKEIEIVQNAINSCNRQGYIFYTLTILVVGARGIFAALANWPYDKNNYFDGNVTVIVNDKIMPYATWLPFEYNKSPSYELVFAFQIFSTTYYGFYIASADAVIYGFMMLIKAQFLIIKRELETLIERAQQAASQEISSNDRIEILEIKTQKFIQKYANDCVIHHQELIALCEHAEEDFCYLMLCQFMASLLVMCCQLFQLSTSPPGSAEFVSMLSFLLFVLFQLLCFCWHGNEVQIVSGEISKYVFEINWLIMKESIKKTLLLIMMRSQRPNYFTAGKFSLLSLQTFMSVVRGASSYFMFLRHINK